MNGVRRAGGDRLARAAWAMPLGAVVVHQLRFGLGYGAQSGAALSEQGHEYLHSLAPWAVVALAAGAGAFLARLARGGMRGAAHRSSLLRLWIVTAAALVAVYVAQETLEGMLATGHPTGFAGVFGHGGWWALPAALAVGLAIALALRTADAIVARVHRAGTSARARERARTPPSYDCAFSRAAPLALAAAGRAPPAG